MPILTKTQAGGGGSTDDIWDLTSNVVSNTGADSDETIDDFVFGSPSLSDDGNADHDSRMFFDKSKGAFRAGTVNTNQWDDVNVGTASAAFGTGCKATATDSFSAGLNNEVTAERGACFGGSSTVTDESSFSAGFNNDTSGSRCCVVGIANEATAQASVLLGSTNDSTTSIGIGIGLRNNVTGFNSVCIGQDNESPCQIGVCIGDNNVIIGGSPRRENTLIGSDNTVNQVDNAVLIGSNSDSTGDESILLGNFLDATQDGAIIIGNGVDVSNQLQNTISNAIMFGSNSTIPTVTITDSGGIGNTGEVGIVTTSPNTKLDVEGDIAVRAVSPSQITADQNDYTGMDGFSFARLSSDASRTITGIANGFDGKKLYIVNVGSNDIILANQNASSTDTNRIITGTGADVTLSADQTATLIYDNTTQRWRIFN